MAAGLLHTYSTELAWTGNLGTGTDSYKSYRRTHEVSVPGLPTIQGSADPHFHGDADRWNPEQLLLAALSQCHLLSYLHVCAVGRVVVTAYTDRASGVMEQTRDGGGHFVEAVLRPSVTVAEPSMVERATEFHAQAHRMCFIAGSVNFPVRHEPTVIVAG